MLVYLITNSINPNKILNIIVFHNKFINKYFLINKILAIQNNLLQNSFFKTINIKELFLKAWHLNYNFKMWKYCKTFSIYTYICINEIKIQLKTTYVIYYILILIFKKQIDFSSTFWKFYGKTGLQIQYKIRLREKSHYILVTMLPFTA